MAKLVLIFFAAVAFSAALAAPKQDDINKRVEDLRNQIPVTAEKIVESFKKGIINNEEMNAEIDAVKKNFEDLIEKVKTSELPKEFVDKMSAHVKEMKENFNKIFTPEVQAKMDEFKGHIEEIFKKGADEFEKTRAAMAPTVEEAGKTVKKTFDDFYSNWLDITEKFYQQVKTATEPKH